MLYSCTSLETLHPELQRYLHGEVAQSATHREDTGCYHYRRGGREIKCGGIRTWLETLFHPNHKGNKSKRRHGRTSLVGSNKKQGKLVDEQIRFAVEKRALPKKSRWNPLTKALLEHWKTLGHTLQAAQVPVELANGWARMTQVDVITRCEADGRLWLWEVKTGFPVGFYRAQKSQPTFSDAPFRDIPCTPQNIWFLQLRYTHQALYTSAGVPIEEGCARILHVYKRKGEKTPIVEERAPPPWLTSRVPLWAPPREGTGVPTVLKRARLE